MEPNIKKLDRLREVTDVPVSILTDLLLDVSRTTYYSWKKGAEIRKSRHKRFVATMRVLAIAYKQGKLPIKNEELTRDERNKETMKVLRDVVRSMTKK
jgi:hypothetical protein